MRRWLFAALLAAGCGAEPKPLSAPVPVGNPGATERRPLESVQRPDVVRSFPMDYAAIPHLVAQPLSPDDEKARVGFASVSSLGDARVSHDLIVEIEAGGLRAFTAEPLAGASSTAQPAPICVGRKGVASVSWEGFSRTTWTDEFIDYVRYEGDFDELTCVAKPARVARVRAPAVIPGVAYAFRTCVPVCTSEPVPGSGEELLVLVTPKARWVGATAPWLKLQTAPHVGLFTRLIVPMKKGGAASTFAHVDRAEALGFANRLRGKAGRTPDLPAVDVLQLGFDFSWPEADPLPIGIGFVGAVQTTVPRPGETPEVN